MSNFVISGYGKSSPVKTKWMIAYIISAIVLFVGANTIGVETLSIPKIGWTQGYSTSYTNDYFQWFIIGGICCIVLAILSPIAISKSQIEVYEDRVEGVGISKWFYFGDVRTFNFLLNIDQVSVDVNGSQLIVHGLGSEYKVYVENGTEIQNAIFQLKKSENKN